MPKSPFQHSNATTNTAIRFAIQTAPKTMTNVELARRFDVSPTTVARWRKRRSIMDRSSAPKKHGRKKLTKANINMILKVRKEEHLGLDPLLQTVNEKLEKLDKKISRSRLAQILKEYNV